MQAYYSTIYCFVHFFFIDNSLLLVLYHSFLLRLKFHSNRMVDKRMAKITIFTLEKLSKTIECICHVPLLIFFEWLWSLCCKIWNTFFAAHRVAFKWICFTVIVGNPNDKKSIFNALSGFLWLAARWSKLSWFPFGQHFWYHKNCTNFFGFRNDSWSSGGYEDITTTVMFVGVCITKAPFNFRSARSSSLRGYLSHYSLERTQRYSIKRLHIQTQSKRF